MTALPAPDRFATAASPRAEPHPVAEADVWVWLSGLFAEAPSPEAIAFWRSPAVGARIAQLAADADLAEGLGAMRAAWETHEDPGAVAARLGHTFGRLFLGLAGPETISPYESAQRFGRLFQAPASEMAALVAAHDLSVAETTREPADHLAIELALMARLVATDHPDRAVLADRLAAWVPGFRDQCVARDASGLWAGAARVLAAVVDRETRRRIPS